MDMPINAKATREGSNKNVQRYAQLVVLVLAAGAIYPVLYLRQVYQNSMMLALGIDNTQLGYLYSILGVAFMVSYLPSGWLADRVSPRLLISVSLLGTGLLALWYATLPNFHVLLIIFSGFGITTGLTFWAALLKRVGWLAGEKEQGRFFGVLDGGRGLVEALLATIAIWMFARATTSGGESTSEGFEHVILLYAITCLVLGIVMCLLRDPPRPESSATKDEKPADANLLKDLKQLTRMPELWLVTAIVFCGYHFFWATYSFSAYLTQDGLGLSATMAGVVTTIKLWMRPIGGIGGGWLGDRFSNLRVLTYALALASVGMLGLIFLPALHVTLLVVILAVLIGLVTYTIRALYWAILDQCAIPSRITGLAIGIISVVGYSPDVLLPLINGWLTETFPGMLGYRLYFGYVFAIGSMGVLAAVALKKRIDRRNCA
ncbi:MULTISPECIES: MFS transporter [unclassified Dyella]|uniref:MFS transporter n=1 Tax=unclassified Dyella TaxID=2634549 RepID=UPI000C836BF7|nr:MULTISPECIES: MFS transporter [unclassified Dyella]MDR3446185.1 MFS transporter [Dyella sp.]PMQ04406.1 Inner membrane protein YqcE [Dyella sp. AD56]